jgi:hypothetical protein
MKSISAIKIILTFILATGLLYVGFTYLLTDEQRKLIFKVPFVVHIVSFLLIIPSYMLNGLELNLLYRRVGKIKLSVYDTLTLPFVVNLWGFIIPFQGSFFYTVAYLLAKYKKNISESARVYLISFSITISFTGLIAGIFYFISDLHFPRLFLAVCCLLFVNPVLLYLAGKLSLKYKSGSRGHLDKVMQKVTDLLSQPGIDKKLIPYLVLLKFSNIILTGLWSYWIAVNLNLHLGFVQLILIASLMNMTSFIKITPGNLGINQFASGGIAILVGGSLNDGFILSSFQYLTIILAAVVLGGAFSFHNFKYLNWKALRSTATESQNTI